MNDVVFPERVDFGVHAVGETIRRTIRMVCKVGKTYVSNGPPSVAYVISS